MSSRAEGAASCRTIIVTQHSPPAMRKRDVWRIDQFHLLRKVGSGYASTVYLGTCRTTGNQVAIKLYHKNKLSELNHFQVAREITIHSGLDHKHIIQLWSAFEDQYGIYLVFEYASKGDVFTEVERRGGQLTEAESVRQVIYPFLSALDYLHSNYIIHRDIKPENLLFTATGVLKVGDFGLSINFSQERAVTRVGTLDYMAPEVVVCPDKHRPQDHKELKHLHYTPLVDAWAVGVLAYELIVGRPPFDKGQKKATINEILNGEPFIPPWLSEGAVHFIKWALTKDQGRRPSVKQLSEHPWIVGHMKQQTAVLNARRLVKTDSFVEPRQLGFRDSNMQSETAPSVPASEPPRPLQVASVAQGGRTLGHSNSMSAVDGMRYRDVHLDSVGGGMAAAAEAALASVKRVSDGDGTTGGRPSAAGGRVSRAGTARNSGAGGLSRKGSFTSAAAVAAAAGVAAEDASKSGRPMTREELMASLNAPSGNRSLNMMRSFTAGRPNPGLHVATGQPGMRTSGGGATTNPHSPRAAHPPSAVSPLGRSTVGGAVNHETYASHPSAGGLTAHASADLAVDLGRLRVDTSNLSVSAGGAPYSPRSGTTPLRPQPPQAPSPSARGLKTGSPLIPSRLSQSFTSPISPLAVTTSVQHPPSRLGPTSNSGAVHGDMAAASAGARHVFPNRLGTSMIEPGVHASCGSPGGISSSPGGVNSASLNHSGHFHSYTPSPPSDMNGSSGGAVAGVRTQESPASTLPAPAVRELPGERDDPEEYDSSASNSHSGSISKETSKGRGLFGSFKKVFS